MYKVSVLRPGALVSQNIRKHTLKSQLHGQVAKLIQNSRKTSFCKTNSKSTIPQGKRTSARVRAPKPWTRMITPKIRFCKSPVAAVACAARFRIVARLRPFALRFCPDDGFRWTSNGILIILLPDRRFYTTSNGILLLYVPVCFWVCRKVNYFVSETYFWCVHKK